VPAVKFLLAWIAFVCMAVAACGGGGSNPLDNPATVVNPPGGSGQALSFTYFQRCINPVLVAQLALPAGGTGSCATSGCHDNANGTGGAFRMDAAAAFVDPAATTPDAIRLTAMYRNFFSAQGSSTIGAPAQSRLLTKPLVEGVLHGGGVIFASADDPNAKLLQYWIARPMPQGQDEFSSAADAMFSPTGACNTTP
jgi:hypothetical protein